ncbi:MAG: glycosyltransferase [Polyangiaceae bacterium]|nr:glycosyltransferase [Polyangiaceae bacterium]
MLFHSPAPFPSGRPYLAVLIPTKNRHKLLATRALLSVLRQTRRPDWVIVVDDSNPPLRSKTRHAAAQVLPDAIYLENARTPGLSGACNTGLAWLLSGRPDPRDIFVAVLDDDDAWTPAHLERCLDIALCENADIVVPGLVRHDKEHPEGRKQEIPNPITENALLAGNPHVQGSNLFVRLSAMAEAGLFDEALPSTTDRDLWLRLLDLGSVRLATLREHTVHHYAEPDRPRLSRPGSPEKREGLHLFYAKYRGRMSADVEACFLRRAETLFGVRPEPPTALPFSPPSVAPSRGEVAQSISLVVGMVVDPSRVASFCALMSDLRRLAAAGFSGLDVVIVENGPRLDESLRALAQAERDAGLRVYFVDIEQQARDASEGAFGDAFDRGFGRVGIATGRTMVSVYTAYIAAGRAGAVVWILDDDKRIDPADIDAEQAGIEPLVARLSRLRQAGHAVVLCGDADSPPLPAASALRVQLVDILHNLRWLAGLSPDEALPDRSAENYAFWRRSREPYHDLSSFSDHLEWPCWLTPAHTGETADAAFTRFSEQLPRIVAGQMITRPLPCPARGDVVAEATPSIHRGGSTFILDIEVLRTLNPRVDLGVGELRRSDMAWALAQRAMGRSIVAVPMVVHHDRSRLEAADVDLDALGRDLQGHAFYRALDDIMKTRPKPLPLEPEQFDAAWERFQTHLNERLCSFEQSAYRIRGLIQSIRIVLKDLEVSWLAHVSRRESISHIERTLTRIERAFAVGVVGELLRRVRAPRPEPFREALTAFGRPLGDARIPAIAGFIESERKSIAAAQITRLTGRKDLRFLGAGMEGVVFTDGARVYKYLDAWRARADKAQRALLQSLKGRFEGRESLPPILDFIDDGAHAMLVMPYEPSTPYTGGCGAGLVRLLRELREEGLMHRNIAPKNLVLAGDRVKLVDYGLDLRPFDEGEFEQMCRRAWLTFRWHHRPDLPEIMRAARSRDDLPELCGYERFRQAVETSQSYAALTNLLLTLTVEQNPRRVLDHGCGKGQLARALGEQGIEVTAFDPDPLLARGWEKKNSPGVRFTFDVATLRNERPFDIVISSLVLCTLDDDEIYRDTLAALRAHVSDTGRVLLAVCHPSFVHGGDTPLQERHLPEGADRESPFVWRKTMTSTGRERHDVYRPLERLRLDLRRARLEVTEIFETETVDLERFEPASDFLVLVLQPLPVKGSDVSLLIRACAMEHATIEEQVRHLVNQLEGPHVFAERVVVVDFRGDAFLRQYMEADWGAFDAAMDRLLRENLIDRVLRLDPAHVPDLHERWFGLDAPAAHTVNGVPNAVSLFGMEVCKSTYVLSVDADLLIVRRDHSHDHLADMIRVFEADPHALTVAMNICHNVDKPYEAEDDRGVPFRTEVRGALHHRERLLSARPLPNERMGNALAWPWYRALDRAIGAGAGRSYRGGDTRTFFIHPPNTWKRDRDAWLLSLDQAEAGCVPNAQNDRVEVAGDISNWLIPKRREKFVFVVTGRDVPPGRMQRCLASLFRQKGPWGAVIVDDASTPSLRERLRHLVHASPCAERITLLCPRVRRGQLANLVWAIRHVCVDLGQVIFTVDLDDMLLGDEVVLRVAREYERGADLTVGSMLRTDAHRSYPVTFERARERRGGNVWQHLRTFQKHLFDRIPDEALMLDGAYVDFATDWAYMLPMVEAAKNPIHIPDPLYLYEPSGRGKGIDRARREEQIARIMDQQRRIYGGAK